MNIQLNVEGKIKNIVEERVQKIEKAFWKELDKLRKRIVELEMKGMDFKRREIWKKKQ